MKLELRVTYIVLERWEHKAWYFLRHRCRAAFGITTSNIHVSLRLFSFVCRNTFHYYYYLYYWRVPRSSSSIVPLRVDTTHDCLIQREKLPSNYKCDKVDTGSFQISPCHRHECIIVRITLLIAVRWTKDRPFGLYTSLIRRDLLIATVDSDYTTFGERLLHLKVQKEPPPQCPLVV